MITTIPNADPMPVPGPVWLLKTLLLVTFFLHVLLMNFSVGGAVIALVSRLRAGKDSLAGELSRKLVSLLPSVFAFTITLGVAALLFVQVLFGQLLYSSSVLMGVAWLSVILLVIIGYYGIYWAALRHSVTGLALAVVMLLTIGFIYVNNMTLMLTPERWLEMYKASAAGLHLNTGEASLVPRYLHMMLSAIAFGGLLVAILGLRDRRPEVRAWLLRQGALWFTIPTVLNAVVGFWFLVTLRRDVLMLFMGESKWASVLLGLGFLLMIAAVVHLLLALAGRKPERQVVLGIASAVLTVAVMVLMRDVVRTGYLKPVFDTAQLQVAPQWDLIGIFLVLFVAGLATLAWMLRKVAASGRAVMAKTAIHD